QELLYITPEYFGQLARKLRPDPNKVKPEPRSIEDTPAYRAGYRKGREAAEEESEDLITETEIVEDSDVPTAAQSPQSKLADAVSYFAAYTEDVPMAV